MKKIQYFIIAIVIGGMFISLLPNTVLAKNIPKKLSPKQIRSITTATTTPNTTSGITPEQRQCILAAVEKRDNALIAAVDARYNATKTAFQTRKADLVAAWGLENRDERRKAIKYAWNKFDKSIRAANKAFKAAKKKAWSTFYKDRKACGQQVISDDRFNEGADNSL